MVNTKLRSDDMTLEALSVVDEHALLLASAESDKPLYENGDDIRQHEHSRPPSMRSKREKTTLGEVDKVRAQALSNTLRHGLNQLLKQPPKHVSDVQRHFTADESFVYLVFDSEERPEPWRFLLPWSDVYRKSLPEPSRHRPINRAPDPSRDDPERTDMTLESALLHLKPLDVNANSYFPDSATYVGDAEPEFKFDFLEGAA